MHEKKFSQAEIARVLQQSRSTICRELRRNFWQDHDEPIAEGGDIASYPHLCAAVIDRLKNGWSPEQIFDG